MDVHPHGFAPASSGAPITSLHDARTAAGNDGESLFREPVGQIFRFFIIGVVLLDPAEPKMETALPTSESDSIPSTNSAMMRNMRHDSSTDRASITY